MEVWDQIAAAPPEMLAALAGGLVGGLVAALVAAVVTWLQFRNQRRERERSERREAYLTYINWAMTTKAGIPPADDDRPVDVWDAGALEAPVMIFGSEIVRGALRTLSNLRYSAWWGIDTPIQRDPRGYIWQRKLTAGFVTSICQQMEDELRNGATGGRFVKEAMEAIGRVESPPPKLIPPD